MFRLDVLQNQWLFVALAGGLALVLGVALFCLAIWRERPQEPEASRPRRRVVPALLILAYVFAAIFVIVYTLIMARHPPNW